jgi:hypothetical protein
MREAVANMVAGDLDTAKAVLREYINGAVGFVALGEALSKSPKSLMRRRLPRTFCPWEKQSCPITMPGSSNTARDATLAPIHPLHRLPSSSPTES